MANFAWFANPLFLLSAYRVWQGKPAIALSFATAFVAADSFRVNTMPLNAAGHTSTIYGLGWGWFVWFSALLILISAAGTQRSEQRISSGNTENLVRYLRLLGFVLLGAFVACVAYLALTDRNQANESEKARLAHATFKIGPVCAAPEPTAQQRFGDVSGSIEVLSRSTRADSYPYDLALALLKWGLPVVKVGLRDYSYMAAGDRMLLTSVPSSAPVAGRLTVQLMSGKGQVEQRKLELLRTGDDQLMFSQTWRSEQRGNQVYCPDFSTYPKTGEEPRKVISDVLGLNWSTELPNERLADDGAGGRGVKGAVVERGWLSPTTRTILPRLPTATTWDLRLVDDLVGRKIHGCPPSVALGDGVAEETMRRGVLTAISVGERTYYLEGRDRHKLTCRGDVVYLHAAGASSDGFYLRIEKRTLSDFRQVWSTRVEVFDPILNASSDQFSVISVDDDTGKVGVVLANLTNGQAVRISAPMKSAR
jgi:hypothetical protein